MTMFTHQQRPTNFESLTNVNKWMPSNLDGITERLGRFLIFEIKRGEKVSIGQERMLLAFSKMPECLVLLVNSEYQIDAKGGLEFLPMSYHIGVPSGWGPLIKTTPEDFASRYEQWCRRPSGGTEHWRPHAEGQSTS